MSEILGREKLTEVLDRAIYADDYEHDRRIVLAHDATLRAENERLREAAEMVCERLAGVGGDYYREIAPGLMDDIEALQRALAAPQEEGEEKCR